MLLWTGPAFGADAVEDTPAPVSNSFAMGGGLSGAIDERTGAFQASFPLVALGDRDGVGASFSLGYDQSLAAQGTDRFGLGAGWTLGMPWVDTVSGVQVYPATGGSYAYDASKPTGLGQYPLRDLKFAKSAGEAAPRPGLPEAQPYVYTLTYLDGSEDRFNAAGNLVERVDRFGNRIDITWRQSGSLSQPTTMVDNYGQVTSFDYQPGEVTVTSPPRSDGKKATVTLTIQQGRLAAITDPVGQKTQLTYVPVPGLSAPLLQTVESPTGERTVVSYNPVTYEQQLAVVVVEKVRVTDAGGADVLAERNFSIDPQVNVGQHNYTGYPTHVTPGGDGLFESGDTTYRYTTQLSDGTSTVQSTYNSLHLLTMRRVLVRQGLAMPRVQEQELDYLPASDPDKLPANYSKPTSTKVTYGPIFGPTRSVQTSSSYDDRGQLGVSTDESGAVTKTEFDPRYGLPTRQTVTGTDGTTSITINTPTGDGKAIDTTTTLVGAPGQTPTARSVTTYTYNDFGELTGQSLAWAAGAKPPGPSGGADAGDETRTVDVDASTRIDTVTTAAGTASAASTKTVSDLVTGKVVSQTDPAGRTTSYSYDAAGRVTSVAAPGDLTTKTDYTSPLTTTTTSPDGHIRHTTTDVLGRTIKVTDNVSNQKLVADPTARTLATSDYTVDGSKITSSGPTGAVTTTLLDPLGRQIKKVKPNGITEATAYDDVKNTKTRAVIPGGGQASDPSSVTVEALDDLNRPTSSNTSYLDGTEQAPSSQSYDGLGRVTGLSAADVKATPSYAGAGGLQAGVALTPTDPGTFPGAPVAAATDNTLTGAPTRKTLSEAGDSGAGAAYSYDPAGRVQTVVAPGGAETAYTYTPDGKVATVTSPSDVLTSYSYDAAGRLAETEVTTPGGGGTQKTQYEYDPDTGRLTAVLDPDQPADRIGYEHDADGHTTAVHYPDGTTTTASYNDSGQLAAATDITGATTRYTYNAAGDLTGAVQTRDGGTSQVRATLAGVTYDYDSLDRVKTITRGNGVKTAITYTDANQVKSESTTAANGTPLATRSYSYDAHGNLQARTDQTQAALGAGKPRGAAKRRGAARPRPARGQRRATAASASTTTYTYDAYNRLIGSATYPGTSATGTPTTETTYTLSVAGDVVGEKTTSQGATTSTTNTFAPGNRLTTRTVDGKDTEQRFDADGNVTRDLGGDTYTYDPIGHPTSVTTPDGTTITYDYWPDHTLRSATTTAKGVAHTTTFHNNPTGVLANDTYSDGPAPAGGAAGAGGVTASYLLAARNRESRTLVTDGGPGPSSAAAVRTTGPGTGYYIRDRHGSVTALIDRTGQLTDSYRYSDYGEPTQTSSPAPGAGAAGDPAVNPFTYNAAYTDPTTGKQILPARTYDPSQGRFLMPDSADLLNRYQAFSTNPITLCDTTGQWSISDTFSLLGAVVAVVAAVATGGAAFAADAALFAAIGAGEEVAASTVTSAVLLTTSAAANVGAAATTSTLFADDAAGLSGHHFLSNDQRAQLTSATLGLGAIGAAAGVGGLGLAPAGASEVSEAVTEGAAEQTGIGPQDTDLTSAGASKRNAVVAGEEPDLSSMKRWAIEPDEPPLATSDDSNQKFEDTSLKFLRPELLATEPEANPTAPFLQNAYKGRVFDWYDPDLAPPFYRFAEPLFDPQAMTDAGLTWDPTAKDPSPWAAVDEVDDPEVHTASGPDPAPRSTPADTGPLGPSGGLDHTAGTSITNTLQSNWQLVSAEPPH
jgi:RHS repeat-associated protein